VTSVAEEDASLMPGSLKLMPATIDWRTRHDTRRLLPYALSSGIISRR
jgi:hypothetical protein